MTAGPYAAPSLVAAPWLSSFSWDTVASVKTPEVPSWAPAHWIVFPLCSLPRHSFDCRTANNLQHELKLFNFSASLASPEFSNSHSLLELSWISI